MALAEPMFFFLGGWRTRHRARSAVMGCGGGEGKGGGYDGVEEGCFLSYDFFLGLGFSSLTASKVNGRTIWWIDVICITTGARRLELLVLFTIPTPLIQK